MKNKQLLIVWLIIGMMMLLGVTIIQNVVIKDLNKVNADMQIELDEHNAWLDFTADKIADLQRQADHTQTTCIDILYGY